MENTCKDCRFYLPVDVFKGICKQDKRSITPDDPECTVFDRLPKCKFCTAYIPEKDFLGKCKHASLAYPDMNASKCATFEWYNLN
jgi:4-hydroxyphenylacetate decarboxylase small subunit